MTIQKTFLRKKDINNCLPWQHDTNQTLAIVQMTQKWVGLCNDESKADSSRIIDTAMDGANTLFSQL